MFFTTKISIKFKSDLSDTEILNILYGIQKKYGFEIIETKSYYTDKKIVIKCFKSDKSKIIHDFCEQFSNKVKDVCFKKTTGWDV